MAQAGQSQGAARAPRGEPPPPGAGATATLRVGLGLAAALAAWGLLDAAGLARAALFITDAGLRHLGSAILLLASGALLLCGVLALSRHGARRLGAADDRPEFDTPSWLAMLFAAGMGTGLVVWGVAEPVTHALAPPGGGGLSAASMRQAMVLTYLHWGLHAWAIYALAALVVAWFAFREGRPMTVSAPLETLGGGAAARAARTLADSVGLLAVLFGLAGTLAMGVLTIRSGLGALGVAPGAIHAHAWLVGIGAVALVSAATPLGRGIRILSDVNIALAVLLMALVLLVGPAGPLLVGFVRALADYLVALPRLSFSMRPFGDDGQWTRDWTLTYFLWWLAWGPFVGVFIARISRGRTLRGFLAGVILVPALGSFLWFAILGGSGLMAIAADPAGPVARAALSEPTAALFALLPATPLGQAMAWLTLVLLIVFLVTSIDSAAYVLGMMSCRGAPVPPVRIRLAWGLLLLLLSAGLVTVASVEAVRGMAILGALPYPLILLVQAVLLVLALGSGKGDREG